MKTNKLIPLILTAALALSACASAADSATAAAAGGDAGKHRRIGNRARHRSC